MFSNEEYYDMLMCYGVAGENAVRAREIYGERYANRRQPSANVFYRLATRVRETGSVLINHHDVRRREVRDHRLEDRILNTIHQEPELSIRDLSRMHDVPRTTVHRLLKEERLHPYHFSQVQDLFTNDYFNRLQFCHWVMEKINNDPIFPKKILFSDESLFTREGVFNQHNRHTWGDDNPGRTRGRGFQVRWKFNVWAGILGSNIIGPILLEERLTGQEYLRLLRENMGEFLEDVPLAERNNIFFQQDGAPPHSTRIVTGYLNETFPERWIGRHGPIRWPARSPDLNPLDFFFWGHCKSIVYDNIPGSPDELLEKMHIAMATIDEEMLSNVHRSFIRRVQACIQMGGGHFEHLL